MQVLVLSVVAKAVKLAALAADRATSLSEVSSGMTAVIARAINSRSNGFLWTGAKEATATAGAPVTPSGG